MSCGLWRDKNRRAISHPARSAYTAHRAVPRLHARIGPSTHRDEKRFSRHLATDFLAHLGVIAAFAIENTINRARLVRSGLTDFLTGWHNRRYLHARLTEELARA